MLSYFTIWKSRDPKSTPDCKKKNQDIRQKTSETLQTFQTFKTLETLQMEYATFRFTGTLQTLQMEYATFRFTGTLQTLQMEYATFRFTGTLQTLQTLHPENQNKNWRRTKNQKKQRIFISTMKLRKFLNQSLTDSVPLQFQPSENWKKNRLFYNRL